MLHPHSTGEKTKAQRVQRWPKVTKEVECILRLPTDRGDAARPVGLSSPGLLAASPEIDGPLSHSSCLQDMSAYSRALIQGPAVPAPSWTESRLPIHVDPWKVGRHLERQPAHTRVDRWMGGQMDGCRAGEYAATQGSTNQGGFAITHRASTDGWGMSDPPQMDKVSETTTDGWGISDYHRQTGHLRPPKTWCLRPPQMDSTSDHHRSMGCLRPLQKDRPAQVDRVPQTMKDGWSI